MFSWYGKRVLITGHTGFKGSWLTHWLLRMGAEVFGLSLEPETSPNLFSQLDLANRMDHRVGDIREDSIVAERVLKVKPDVIFHLAAQPLVLHSYLDPVGTWSTNVMGTLNVLEASRSINRRCVLIIITTDKVYENHEFPYTFRENDRLGGHDPYSASKAAAEILVASYVKSFLKGGPVKVATARAGNVIGGGDWAENRIIPDLVKAIIAGKPLLLRNPNAVRPWQHVLDPLAGYIAMAEHMLSGLSVPDSINFGPEPAEIQSVQKLTEFAIQNWSGTWEEESVSDSHHEAMTLALSIELARYSLGWEPRWGLKESVARSIEWYRKVHEGANPMEITNEQIIAFEAASN